MGKPAVKTNSNSSNRSAKGRSKSPKVRHHDSKDSPPNNNRRHHNRRPDAVVFPPDPNETGEQVVNRVLEAFGLSDQFPPDCQQQVATLLAQEKPNPWKKPTANGGGEDTYVDHTHLPYITIDSENTQDLDQAMFITRQNLPGRNAANRTDNTQSTAQCANGYLVSYALADGAHFVPAESPLFQYALKRGGTSFYLPGKSIPMLPRTLSEGVMSLLPNVKRRALIFDIYLTAEGHPLRTFFQWGYIRSRWKGTFQQVSDYYAAVDAGKHPPLQKQEFAETLDLLRELGIQRQRIAQERHVISLQREQRVGVTINAETGMLEFSQSYAPKSHVEQYNEQISLLCNSEGAKLLHFMDALEDKTNQTDIIHPIYRSQREPTPEQVHLLQDVIQTTLQAHEIDTETYGWDHAATQESIAEYLERLRKRRDTFGESSPEFRVWSAVVQVVQRQAMATNVAATLSGTSSGHHGLKVEYYARFSSPMRELVGCFTHKELWEAHTHKLSANLTPETDVALRDQVIRAARRARLLQKKLGGALFLHLMNLTFYKDLKKSLHKRPLRKGVLLGINFAEERNKSRRCYVQLEDEPAIEIKVFAQDLEYFYNCRYVVQRNNSNDDNSDDDKAYTESACAVAIGPLAGSFKEDVDDQDRPPIFKVGQRVTIRVADYAQFYGQTSRSRWCFIMDLDVCEEADVMRLNQSVSKRNLRSSALRNSILDIDLYSTRDSTSVASSEGGSFSEFDELVDV